MNTAGTRQGLVGLALGLVFALLACTGVGTASGDTAAPPPRAAPTAPPPSSEPPPPGTGMTPLPDGDPLLVACEVDADCVVVSMGCCDPCNGGFYMSVAKDFVDAARSRWQETECEGLACTERACNWNVQPVCVAGTCARTQDVADGPSGAVKAKIFENRKDP